ncbi:MAG: hypothetical protein ACREQV_14455 [Candidatus Binatia bacterium]
MARSYGPRDDGTGDRWEQGGMTYTVNSTDDATAGEGGFYLSMQDNETGEKATAVYDADYNLLKFD